MSRLLIKIIWFILGVAALFYGIKGIYFCFTGGTVETLDSSSDGVGGFFWAAVVLLLYRNWIVCINRDKRDKREKKE